MSRTIVADSSVLLEIMLGGALAPQCERYLKTHSVVISVVSFYEIHRKLSKLVNDDMAMAAVGIFNHYEVCEIDKGIALIASDLAVEFDLAMADAMILATAKAKGGELLTLDNDFAKIEGVVVLRH